ncbi:Uncharacterized protein HZ326_16769 [Fusarium oxysporum f. sp. albedinis]|nr:Uncharacterized protein HZ326_16769 [Fusarium oxysporum f. sp. albedinis]
MMGDIYTCLLGLVARLKVLEAFGKCPFIGELYTIHSAERDGLAREFGRPRYTQVVRQTCYLQLGPVAESLCSSTIDVSLGDIDRLVRLSIMTLGGQGHIVGPHFPKERRSQHEE